MPKDVTPSEPLTHLLRAPRGEVDVRELPSDADPGFPGDGKDDGDDYRLALEPLLSDVQERLFANGREDPAGAPRVLVILQGMDTSGKGGVIRHAIGMVDPQGVRITSFKKPTEEELAHDFLWRIGRAVPEPGMIGIFDRSQYEDVLIARVHGLAPADEIERRYDAINAFEKGLVDDGVVLIKCFLHISSAEQRDRLAERLEREDKYWKYNPGDVDERARWNEYMDAYSVALTRCNTDHAPWFVVPADKKWYRNWAVAQLLLEHLQALDLGWPPADFDVETEKRRLKES